MYCTRCGVDYGNLRKWGKRILCEDCWGKSGILPEFVKRRIGSRTRCCEYCGKDKPLQEMDSGKKLCEDCRKLHRCWVCSADLYEDEYRYCQDCKAICDRITIKNNRERKSQARRDIDKRVAHLQELVSKEQSLNYRFEFNWRKETPDGDRPI